MSDENEPEGMHQRRITLADGRYLIFYTFDEPPVLTAAGHASTNNARRPEPDARAEAEEERRV
jgi:hypothetical protein